MLSEIQLHENNRKYNPRYILRKHKIKNGLRRESEDVFHGNLHEVQEAFVVLKNELLRTKTKRVEIEIILIEETQIRAAWNF